MRPRTVAALLAVYLVWGSTYLAIKYLVTGFPPMIGSGIRFLVAGAVLLLLGLGRGQKLSLQHWWAATQLGALLLVGGVGMVTVAESTGIGSGLAATAVAAIPIWVALIGGPLGGWPTGREWWGLVLGLAGVALLSREGDFSTNLPGAITLFAAPISWAVGSIRRTRVTLPSGMSGVAAEMLTGGTLLALIGVARGERFLAAPPLQAWLGLAYLIVFGSIVAFSAYMYLLDTERPALATSYAYVNPVVAVLLGLTIGGETLTGEAIPALALILGGVAFLTARRSDSPGRRLLWRRRSSPAITQAACVIET